MKTPSAQRNALIGLVVGVLAVPALVLAADSLLGSDPADAQPATDAAVVAEPLEPVAAPPTTSATATQADVERACGPDGQRLVQKEREGSITDLEKAALDALRPICEDEGLALPGPEAPVVVETVQASLPAATSTTIPSDDDDDSGHGDDDEDSGDDESWDDSADSFESPDDSAESWDD